MILLTGATGAVGLALLDRLLAERRPVRCLVRDPARLGPRRVRVQLALGDLTDPPSFRNALRGVTSVVHLAGARRDQPRGSIEEVNGIATWRLVEAARRAGAERFVLLSAAGASAHERARYLRAKALAEEAVLGADLSATVVAPSLVITGRRPWVSGLPVIPVPWGGRAQYAPVLAEDVAACVRAALETGADGRRYVAEGPEVVGRDALLRRVTGRPLVPVPAAALAGALRATEAVLRFRAPVTWDEVELLEVSQLAPDGALGAASLGVTPRPALPPA